MNTFRLLLIFISLFTGKCIFCIEQRDFNHNAIHAFFGSCSKPNWCQIGIAAFSGSYPEWYGILAPTYPTTAPLSLNRNFGSTQGNIQLTPSGLVIGEPGNYFATFSANLTNNIESTAPLIPVFLIRNDSFDPLDRGILGAIGMIPFEQVVTIQGTGILENVRAGTILSLVATNGVSDQPIPITVVSWGISVFRIPCDPSPIEQH